MTPDHTDHPIYVFAAATRRDPPNPPAPEMADADDDDEPDDPTPLYVPGE